MDKTYKIAIVVDMQHDFYAEDGTLKVEGGQKAVENAVKKLKDTDYDVICFTADFHPCNHSSFVENGGTWPKHCVAYTLGSNISMDLLEAAYSNPSTQLVEVFEKGKEADKEEYSFLDNRPNKINWMLHCFTNRFKWGEYYFKQTGDEKFYFKYPMEIDVMGIAGDVCVLNTLKDLIRLGMGKYLAVVEDCVASLDDGSKLRNFCTENNIKMI